MKTEQGKAKVAVTVTFELYPYEIALIGKRRLRQYIAEALENWSGGFFPGDEDNDPDPLFRALSNVKAGAVERIR